MIHAWAGARWYSAEKRHADTVDVPLSKAGVRDARKATAKLSGVKFDIVITSTLKRSFEIAQILRHNT